MSGTMNIKGVNYPIATGNLAGIHYTYDNITDASGNKMFTPIRDYGNGMKLWRKNSDTKHYVLVGRASEWHGYVSVNNGNWMRWDAYDKSNGCTTNGCTGAIRKYGKFFRYYQEFDCPISKVTGYEYAVVTNAWFYPVIEKSWDPGVLNVRVNNGTPITNISIPKGSHDHSVHHVPLTRVNCTDFARRRFLGEQGIRLRVDAEGHYNPADLNAEDKAYAHGWLYPFNGAGVNSAGTYAGPWPNNTIYYYLDFNPCFEIEFDVRNDTAPTVSFSMPEKAFVGDTVNITGITRTDAEKDTVTLSWTGMSNYTGTFKTDGTNFGVVFTKPGTYSITLTGTDQFGESGTFTKKIVVKAETYPTLSIVGTPSPISVSSGATKTVTIKATAALQGFSNCGKTADKCYIKFFELNHSKTTEAIVSDNDANYVTRKQVSVIAADSVTSSTTFSTIFDSRTYKQMYQVTLSVHFVGDASDVYHEASDVFYIDVKNNPPAKTDVAYPLNGSHLYMKNPTILLKTGLDSEKDNVYQYIKINHIDDSTQTTIVDKNTKASDALNYFSSNGEFSGSVQNAIKARSLIVPNVGQMFVTATTIDNKNSESDDSALNFVLHEKDNLEVITYKDEFTIAHLNKVIDKVNSNCKAYGIATINGITYGDEIDYELMISIINAVNSYIDKVNNWDNANSKTDFKKIDIPVDIGYDEIVPVLNKIINAMYL